MGTTLLENYSKKEACPVTGLLNMMQFMRHASLHLQDPMTRPLTFIYFDIENFKSFNQRYSFQQGNRFLRYVADLLRETFPGDLVSRFNDDHFVVATPIEQPDRQVRFIHDHVRIYDTHLPLELKAGIYRPDADVTDVARIVDRAKIACNTIKNTYDLVWAVFDPSMEEELNFRSYIVRNFSKAIMGGHIMVYYQPEVRTMTREICGFEALARWKDPVYGTISPGVFVPVLEDAHLSPQLDLYVIDQVCASMVQIQRDIPDWSLLRISVNLSRADFRLMDMVQAVEDVRLRHGVARQMLNIEVTEGVQGDDETFLQGEIARFRALGYEVWMDDFGSGYSSLNNIKDYVFDVLKIDMNFLRSFETNPKSAIVIRSIVNMAKELGMHTLAEGVETEAQFEFLREIGCEKLQGYYIGRPRPYEESIAHCKEMGFRFETPGKRRYNDDLGNVNLLSGYAHIKQHAASEVGNYVEGIPLSIVEMVGDKLEFLYTNKSFQQELASVKGLSVKGTEEIINNKQEEMYKVVRRFLANLSAGERETLDTIVGDTFFSIRGREISHIPGRNAYIVNLQVYQGDFLKLKQKKMIEKVKDLYKGYELVLLWSPRMGQTELLYLRAEGRMQQEEKDFLTCYAKDTFSKEEGKRFFQFLRQNSALKGEKAVKEKYFMGVDENGKKIVLLVSLKASMLDEEEKILLSIRRLWNAQVASLVAGKLGEGL